MSDDNYEEKYTKPDLRRKIKDELMKSDKGGDPGEWSARKSQMLVQEYEKQGGGYKGEKDEDAHSLEEWTKQEWKTESGEAARHGNATSRYLPKEVWDKLSDKEKQQAERKKEKASREGKQHVEYTPAVRRAMKEAGVLKDDSNGSSKDDEPTKKELYEQAKKLDIEGRSKMDKDELQKAVEKAHSG